VGRGNATLPEPASSQENTQKRARCPYGQQSHQPGACTVGRNQSTTAFINEMAGS